MSALDPVILNGVSNVAKAVAELANQPKGDTVLLDIPVRKGHSFVEGDVALYDTERGDLHDGRAEFAGYFGPVSGGASWVASHQQVVGFDERADGSIVVASTFRDSRYPEGTNDSSRSRRAEFGYLSPSGQWKYAGVALPTYYCDYGFAGSTFLAVADDEYFFIFTTSTAGGRSCAVSVRIVNGELVCGTPVMYESYHYGQAAEKLFYLVGDRSVVVVCSDATNTGGIFKFSSVDGVITQGPVAGVSLPKVSEGEVYQVDSQRIVYPNKTSGNLLQYVDGVLSLVNVTIDWSLFPEGASKFASSSRLYRGFPVGTDIVPGLFVPKYGVGLRCYIQSSFIGGFKLEGSVFTVYPPLSVGSIADDFIYYEGKVPVIAMHPLFTSSVGGSTYYGSKFVRNGLSASISVNTATSIGIGFPRPLINGQLVAGGILFIRQSGESVPASIGAGGRVIAAKFDPVQVCRKDYVSLGGAGMLLRPSFLAGRARYSASAVSLRIRSLQDPSPFAGIEGPVFVAFPAVNSSITSGIKLWICKDGFWSCKLVYTSSRPDSVFAVSNVSFFWDFPSSVNTAGTSPDAFAVTLDIREALL